MPRPPKYSGNITRRKFATLGFDFPAAVINALSQVPPEQQLEALVKLAPYFLDKVKSIQAGKDAHDVSPPSDPLPSISTADAKTVLEILDARPPEPRKVGKGGD